MQCVNACPVFKFLCPLNSTLCTTSNMPFYFSQEYRSKIELINPGSSFPVDPMYIYFCPTFTQTINTALFCYLFLTKMFLVQTPPYISYSSCNYKMWCFIQREWAIANGMRGENCVSSTHATDNICKDVWQPQCVDRTIRCNPLQENFGITDVEILSAPNPSDLTEAGTDIKLSCLNHNYYFDFSVPEDLVSFYYSNNINVTTMYCNKDG